MPSRLPSFIFLGTDSVSVTQSAALSLSPEVSLNKMLSIPFLVSRKHKGHPFKSLPSSDLIL